MEQLQLSAGVVRGRDSWSLRCCCCRAFHELGMDCASWTPAIYHDLLSKGALHLDCPAPADGSRTEFQQAAQQQQLRAVAYKHLSWPMHVICHRISSRCPCTCGCTTSTSSAPPGCPLLAVTGDGTGEGLVRVYYGCVGWPTFLPTSEQDMFAAKVYKLKQQQMKKLIAAGAIPLRDGVVQVGWGACVQPRVALYPEFAESNCLLCLQRGVTPPTAVAQQHQQSQTAQLTTFLSALTHAGVDPGAGSRVQAGRHRRNLL